VKLDCTIVYDNGVKIPFVAADDFEIAHAGAPLLCVEGGSAWRKIGIVKEDFCFGNKLCTFETYVVERDCLFYFLQAPQFIDIFKASTTAIIGRVSINIIRKLLFPLPPLPEQKRITEFVKSQFCLLDQIAKQ
jgi:type I restriction enzyme S subunit